MPVRSNERKLVLDVFSAEGEGTVIKNVRRTYIRSRNACNVKIGTYPVHLGVDPASRSYSRVANGAQQPAAPDNPPVRTSMTEQNAASFPGLEIEPIVGRFLRE